MSSRDQNFNSLQARFKQNIYNTAKGRFRLQVLQRALKPLAEQSPPLRVLDCGAGLGQMSLWFAEHGHQVHAIDIADELLQSITEQAQAQGLETQLSCESISLQRIAERDAAQYDLVLCHAVLEWLAEPEAAIAHLAALLRPSGQLSLMFYNREALVIKNLLRGNFHQAQASDLRGEPGGLTPINPIDRSELEHWLSASALEANQWCGVRSFYDYLPRALQQSRSEQTMLALELALCQREPYVSMARYIHLIAQLKNQG